MDAVRSGCFPLLLAFATAIRDPELRGALPHSAGLLREWDGIGLPPEPVFAVLAAEVQAVDWLELHAEGHRRAIFDAKGRRWVTP